ncbi:histidine kinase [Lachnospiraceae bacterium OttesenSCG-928-D06]|nr:histidine kinase [Lachnospiraceae bacterium OttesenSCG-928-D06]
MIKTFFIRRFARYLFIMLLPTLLVFTISIAITNRQIDQELEQQAENTLYGANMNLEQVISTSIYQNESMTYNTGMVMALKGILSGGDIGYHEAIYLRSIQIMLRSITEVLPYVESVYLYMDNYEKMIVSDLGAVYCNNFDDMEWKEFYDNMPEDMSSLVIRRENKKEKYLENGDILSFYQKMLMLDGVIIMNVDINAYRKSLESSFSGQYEEVLFVNQAGEILFHLGEERFSKEGEYDLGEQFHKLMNAHGGWIQKDNEKYLIHIKENTQYQIYLMSIMSNQAKSHEIENLFGIFALIILANFLLMIILAYTTTERNFRQIRYMIQVFDDAEKGIYPNTLRSNMVDEYDVIMNNIIYVFLNTVHLNQELQEKKYEMERVRIEALQLQINPHFLHNTLQNVELQIKRLEGGEGEASEALRNLSDILKYSLNDAMLPVSLQEEIIYLKKYVEIQKYRFGNQFIVYYEIEECLYEIMVFRLLLQPLVENSILHGIRKSGKKGYVKIKIFVREEKVCFHVIDSGCGMNKEELEALLIQIEGKEKNHIGLSNVNSRLQLYYGKESRLIIRSKKDFGCWIRFSIPYGKDVKYGNSITNIEELS